jgi:hypothetical protein
MHEAVLPGDGRIGLVAIAHQHAARPHSLVQRSGRVRAAAGRVAEQPDRRPRAIGATDLGHLHPHIALGLGRAPRLLEHLHLGLVAVDEEGVQQRIAQQTATPRSRTGFIARLQRRSLPETRGGSGLSG